MAEPSIEQLAENKSVLAIAKFEAKIAEDVMENLEQYELMEYGRKDAKSATEYKIMKNFLNHYYLDIPKLDDAEIIKRRMELKAIKDPKMSIDYILLFITDRHTLHKSAHSIGAIESDYNFQKERLELSLKKYF